MGFENPSQGVCRDEGLSRSVGQTLLCSGCFGLFAPLYGAPLRLGSSGGYQEVGEVALVGLFLAAVHCGQCRRGGEGCVVQPCGAYLGPAVTADVKAEGQHVCSGGWECLGGCLPRQVRWFSLVLTRDTAPWAFGRGELFKAIAALVLFASLLSLMIFSLGWKKQLRGSVVISGFTDNARNEAVLNRLMTSKLPLGVILTELAEQLEQGEFVMTLTWVPRGQNELADALTKGGGNLGFKILPEMVRVADNLYADVKRHKKRGKDEGSWRDDRKTKPTERLRMRNPW